MVGVCASDSGSQKAGFKGRMRLRPARPSLSLFLFSHADTWWDCGGKA